MMMSQGMRASATRMKRLRRGEIDERAPHSARAAAMRMTMSSQVMTAVTTGYDGGIVGPTLMISICLGKR